MNCSHITLLFNVKTSSTSSVASLVRSIISIPTSFPPLIPPLPLISPRRPIAFLPTSIWHRVQMLGRKMPSVTWWEVFLRLQVSTRSARSFARDMTFLLQFVGSSQMFTSTPWSFLLFRWIRRPSPRVTLSLKSLQKRLLPFSTTTVSAWTLIFPISTWWLFRALQWWEHGHSFTKSQLPSSSATLLLLVDFPLSQQSLDVVLCPPDEELLKAWKSQIIGTSPYSTTLHSVVWRKVAGLCTLMAATKVYSLVMKELNLIKWWSRLAMKPGQVLHYLDFYCGIFENHEAQCMNIVLEWNFLIEVMRRPTSCAGSALSADLCSKRILEGWVKDAVVWLLF